MNPPFLNQQDEDYGVCPKCQSAETVSSRAKSRRICLKCGFHEDFASYDKAQLGWLSAKPSVTKDAQLKDVAKIIEPIEPGVTKLIIPTTYRQEFGVYLNNRRILLARPSKTDVWNNIESNYTEFELSVTHEIAHVIFDDWISGSDVSASC